MTTVVKTENKPGLELGGAGGANGCDLPGQRAGVSDDGVGGRCGFGRVHGSGKEKGERKAAAEGRMRMVPAARGYGAAEEVEERARGRREQRRAPLFPVLVTSCAGCRLNPT
jgi:hypothetical protein